MSAAVLELDDVRVRYAGGTEAARGVSLTIGPGECVAVIGESGCGKTTLANTILQILPTGAVVTGRVSVGGTVLPVGGAALKALRGRRAGYVAQDPYAVFDPLRSVGDRVRQAWRYHRLRPPKDVGDRVAALGVADAAARLRDRPAAWSGGMLQRASIAAATAHDPPLIVADEPTSALDADLADDALRTLRGTGSAILLISHDLRLVARHADRIAVMRDGEFVEHGTATRLLEAPAHAYTRTLLAATAPAVTP
ncbi:ATP-binding cassette domain-containing protein [Cryptosporangium sp. NPDC048952]|uniref:ATP-binding cassette domain-containing protein n=1 Tax=Cryptosporangium sp. NPDC048952 TaxID=3363961 RepID=UPI003720308D